VIAIDRNTLIGGEPEHHILVSVIRVAIGFVITVTAIPRSMDTGLSDGSWGRIHLLT
jgi:hypothetical protein